MKVLFLCRDKTVVETLAVALRLRWPDLNVSVVSQLQAGLQSIQQALPEIVFVLDDITDVGVFSAIRAIRKISNLPLVVCTTDKNSIGPVQAFELGADEYVQLPCNLLEFAGRMIALLRRSGSLRPHHDANPIHCGELVINPGTYEVFLSSAPLKLTPTEFRLLHLLAKSRQSAVTRQVIQRTLWGEDVDSHAAVKKYIQRLRIKLGDNPADPRWIKTVHGIGYRFVDPTPCVV